jgi:site-specific recombinase XerD
MPGSRYPEVRSLFLAQLPETHRRFAELREDFLLNYGYNTARAYWGDLEDIKVWAESCGKDVLSLDDKDFSKYLNLLRRRGYSSATMRRRYTAWRGFEQHRIGNEA